MTRYRTIVADPPWPYEGFASSPTPRKGERQCVRVGRLPYEAMTPDELAALPVRERADPCGARLFLWTTNRYLPQSFGVLAAWGFRYRQTLVWRKTGNPSPFGGSVAPNHAEYLLVATLGSPAALARLRSSIIDAPAAAAPGSHSAKPEAFLDLVEQVSPPPRLELFARRQRLGWDTWGNEALCHVDLAEGGA